MKSIKLKLNKITKNTKIELETELEVLTGVEEVIVDEHSRECWIKFEEDKISPDEILKIIEKKGYKISSRLIRPERSLKEHIYFVQGMHCASCEILIEKRLLKLKGIKAADASTSQGEVTIEYYSHRPSTEELNRTFQSDGYAFSDHPQEKAQDAKPNGFFKTFGLAMVIIIGFLIINKLGLGALINVNSKSSLISFFFLGILAGLSTCAALVGGLVLSLSKQWLATYSTKESPWQKLEPHLMFNGGRLLSYGLLGALLGGIGSQLRLSLTFSGLLVIAVSIFMILMALQMLGMKALRKFQLTTPKFITRRIADESKFQGRQMPLVMGALTFFLPCGFTITAQGLALLSGSALQGGLIMFLFALGTAPSLLAIGYSSIKFSTKPHLANRFLKVAGAIVLFFALFNINSQLNVLGSKSFSDIFNNSNLSNNVDAEQFTDEDLPPIIDGKQVLKMTASSTGYSPEYLKVRANIPVRWEITDTGTSGCTNAVLSRGLFSGQIDLTPGKTSIKEFTPTKAGQYKFSCWMGMVSGVIEVVDQKQAATPTSFGSNQNSQANNAIIPSGAQGCGCGGGGAGNCQGSPN